MASVRSHLLEGDDSRRAVQTVGGRRECGGTLGHLPHRDLRDSGPGRHVGQRGRGGGQGEDGPSNVFDSKFTLSTPDATNIVIRTLMV